MSSIEPWLRGPIDGVSPLTAPVLFALEQAREDLIRWTGSLSDEQIWQIPHPSLAPVGFQLKHIAGSLDRLLSYAIGHNVSDEQMRFLRAEKVPEGNARDLLNGVEKSIAAVAAFVRSVDDAQLPERRGVGRKQLPTTLIGLLIHLAEHTQRHVGQTIVTVRVLGVVPD